MKLDHHERADILHGSDGDRSVSPRIGTGGEMSAGLFVYGSLQPGEKNADILAVLGGKWTKATIRGTLLDRGWGARIGFPALVLKENGNSINGYVFQSDRLHGAWDELDAFEGNDYERVLANVVLDSGDAVDAFVYTLYER